MSLLYMPHVLWRSGFSLIPINSDKTPALVSWLDFQQRRANWKEIVTWVAIEGHQLAAVTGRISGVAVVDFDNMALWESFAASPLFSSVRDHLTVRTRRGIHLYLPIAASGPDMRGRHGPGWDLKAHGGYVVVPHAIINEHPYSIIAGDPAQLGLVSDALVAAVVTWLDEQTREPGATADQKRPEISFADIDAGQRLPLATARALYRTWAGRGRNNALFKAARLLHDHFYDEATAVETLADLHIAARPPEGHPEQWPTARLNEAMRTIHSAYSRPRRPTGPITLRQLPNVIRECLNRAGLTCVARVLDALRMKGFGPDAIMTQREMMSVVSGLVGGWSVRRTCVFLRSLALPKTHRHEDSLPNGGSRKKEKTDVCLGIQNQHIMNLYNKNRRAKLITLPSDEFLAEILGCKVNKASDVLLPEDQRTVATYRAALHREYIKRRPGAYGLWWLAHRVGKSKPTLRRYNRLAQIIIEPRAQREVLTRTLLARLPEDTGYAELWYNQAGQVRTPGYWLEDTSGKRYPALRVIAKLLTKDKGMAWLCVQAPNHYYHSSQPERTSIPLVQQLLPLPGERSQVETQSKSPMFLAKDSTTTPEIPGQTPHPAAGSKSAVAKSSPATAKWHRVLPPHKKRLYSRPLQAPGMEYVAQRVHETYPSISVNSARRVVHLVGGQQVHKALAIVAQRLQRGSEVHDPARLFLSIAGYSAAVQRQKDEKKRYRYQVIWPRRARRHDRKDS